MREIKLCEHCGRRFESYHPARDRFCCKEHSNAWHYSQRKQALQLIRECVGQGLESIPKTAAERIALRSVLTPTQIEPRPSFATVPSQIEAKPLSLEQTTWPEEWQCVKCDKRWPISTLYCDCEPQPISSESDF